MKPVDAARDLRALALGCGADFFGIADLAPVRDVVVAQGGEPLAAYPRAVSIGIALPADAIDALVRHHDARVAQAYEGVYDAMNRGLDLVATSVADRLRAAGARALAVCASRRIDQDRLCGLFSHKLAAHLAGLGWIGKSCLLITPEVGPRARWTTVLTDAVLPPTGGPLDQACGGCQRCVDACPARAFTGEPFRAEQDRDARFDARKCASYVTAMTDAMGARVLCGLCVAVCPHGMRRQERNERVHPGATARGDSMRSA